MVNELHRFENAGGGNLGAAETAVCEAASKRDLQKVSNSSTVANDGNQVKLMLMSRCRTDVQRKLKLRLQIKVVRYTAT